MEKEEEGKQGGNASTGEREEQKGDATCEEGRNNSINNKDKLGLLAELPMDLVVLLLESMPASTLGNMACTCHYWRDLIYQHCWKAVDLSATLNSLNILRGKGPHRNHHTYFRAESRRLMEQIRYTNVRHFKFATNDFFVNSKALVRLLTRWKGHLHTLDLRGCRSLGDEENLVLFQELGPHLKTLKVGCFDDYRFVPWEQSLQYVATYCTELRTLRWGSYLQMTAADVAVMRSIGERLTRLSRLGVVACLRARERFSDDHLAALVCPQGTADAEVEEKEARTSIKARGEERKKKELQHQMLGWRITDLALRNADLTQRGISLLGIHCPNLRKLELCCSQEIEERAFVALFAALDCRRMEKLRLELCGKPLTDAILQAFLLSSDSSGSEDSFCSLRKLFLEPVVVSETGLSRMLSACPLLQKLCLREGEEEEEEAGAQASPNRNFMTNNILQQIAAHCPNLNELFLLPAYGKASAHDHLFEKDGEGGSEATAAADTITDEGFDALVKGCPRLRRLRVPGKVSAGLQDIITEHLRANGNPHLRLSAYHSHRAKWEPTSVFG
ncbi:hypothetical protein QOT17_024115 [Balamuthia mandrillaris]